MPDRQTDRHAHTYLRTQDRQTDGLQAIHIYIHACTPARTLARTHAHTRDRQTDSLPNIHKCMYACTSARTIVRTYAHTCLWAYGRACMSVSLCASVPVCLSGICVCVCVHVCLYLSLSVCMSVRLCERACLSACLSVYLSVCLSGCCCLSICPVFPIQCNNSEVRSKN